MNDEPRPAPIRLYGSVSELPAPAWAWVEGQLLEAGTYWVVGHGDGHPPARPVWGIWSGGALLLSIGSPLVRAAVATDPRVTVHLGSGTDVVIVEGVAAYADTTPELLAEYDRKYGWEYDLATYGALTRVTPKVVRAWRAAGRDGRDGFSDAGRWDFSG
jgi:hypothetical protein